VVQNGVAVKDSLTGRTLRASYVSARAYPAALGLLSAFGPPAVYIDLGPHSEIDLVTARGNDHHPFLTEYLEANRAQTRWVDSLATPPSDAVAMLSAMAEREALQAALATLARSPIAGTRANLIENKSYRGHILEIVSDDTGKWQRLSQIARTEGIAYDEIVAIGDDENDRELIANAGLGIAMANASASIRAVADHVTASNDDDGVARAIHEFLL
jgi:hydroxymethylpyrimidine pyrophosphatase-like HAD family hydrolase